MTNRLTLLGTGTCQLQTHRMASSVLIELDDLRLVYDFGRGIAQRLAELAFVQDDIEHIFLSHFHPDHLTDLFPYLHAATWSQIDARHRDLHIYGPVGLKELLPKMLSLFGPKTLHGDDFEIHLHEIRDDAFRIGDRELRTSELPPADNRGLAFRQGGKTYAVTGDSWYHEEEVEFLRGVDLAIIDSGHPNDDELLELAVRTQVPELICSHVYREHAEADLNARAREHGYTGRMTVARDLMVFEI